MILAMYIELKVLISLQVDLSLLTRMGDAGSVQASQVKNARDLQFWKFGKLVNYQYLYKL